MADTKKKTAAKTSTKGGLAAAVTPATPVKKATPKKKYRGGLGTPLGQQQLPVGERKGGVSGVPSEKSLQGHAVKNSGGASTTDPTGGSTAYAGARAKGKAKVQPPAPQQYGTLDLAAALQPYVAPYENQLKQLAAQNQGGPPGLAQYLQNVPAGIAQTITAGLGKEGQDMQGMEGAIASQIKETGNAGLLTDLLNAAKYQQIYKGNSFGQVPSTGSPIGTLYNKVIATGNALNPGFAASPGTNPSQIKAATGSAPHL